MVIPPAENFYYPTLKFFEDNQIHDKKEVLEFHKEYFSLTEEDLNLMTRGGTEYVHKKHSGWAVADLYKAGLLLRVNHGNYKISRRGSLVLNNYGNVTRYFLMLFNSFRNYKQITTGNLKIFQIIKRVNNTELGFGNTHETYVRLNNNVDGNIIFNDENQRDFINKRNFKIYPLTYSTGRECRFNGLGDFYRENNLSAGDEVIFERRIINGKDYYLIDFLHFNNNIILQKFSQGFEILSGDINTISDKKYNGQEISINFSHAAKKRQDSPNTTDFYDFCLDGKNQLENYRHNDIIEVRVDDIDIKIILMNTCIANEMELVL